MPKKKDRPYRDVKPVLHIYCEGEKTEPNYLNDYIAKYFPTNRLLKVVKIETTKKNTPKQLVDEAAAAKAAAKKNSLDDDVFWVVYDRESEQKYSDKLHAAAYDKAQKHAIYLAISNVCFEVWLLLHFHDTTAQFANFDDLKKNSTLRSECKKRGLLDYDKADKTIFSILTEDEIKQARSRAKKINKHTEECADSSSTKPYQWNPYTDVYRLLDAIDEFAKK